MTTSTDDQLPQPRPRRIAAVIVTFNRAAMLKECITAVRNQRRRPNEIIVVNNGSTDGTASWLAEQNDLTVITQANSGSSGGQFTGIKSAFERGHDWFWCMDDDTVPSEDALKALVQSRPFHERETGFLWSLTHNSLGRIDAVVPTVCSEEWWGTVARDRCIRIDQATFVSLMVSRAAVETVGLPLRWMFIWGEDTEFTKRISGSFKGWVVLDSVVVHKYLAQSSTADGFRDPRIRTRYMYLLRNELARHRIDPTIHGHFARLRAIISTLYMTLRWVLLGKLPLRTLAWACDGLFRRIKFEFPDNSQSA